MKNLMDKDGREIGDQSAVGRNSFHIEEYRRRISDVRYLDHAIQKIATDLSHYLTK